MDLTRSKQKSSVIFRWVLLALSAALSLRYLIWRATRTLNYDSDLSLFVSVLLLAAEGYGFVSVLLFFLQVADQSVPDAAPVEGELPTVDVLVPIYNEPIDILRRTLIACRALDYPRSKLTLYVLDDGGRPEVAELAALYEARYIVREKREHAKAGNQNNALRNSHGELLLLLDTDHIPVSSFLRETVGYFQRDPRLAFVQTPHHFYNPDCYQRNLILDNEVTHEQDLFFQLIQSGRNSANATVFAGSAAVFRRTALEDIGGFRVDCAIEDLHTGMELQARGWRSIYLRKTLSAGLSPEDFSGYLIQRMRWTRGGVQLFFLDNPLIKKGLNLRQRFAYLASLLYFFHAWARLVYLLAPLSFLLLNINPIVASPWVLLWYFLPHYAASHFIFNRISREYRSPFWSDVYETASVFALACASLAAMFRPETVVFNVTPKGLKDGPRSNLPRVHVLPHIVLLALLVAGLVKATYHFAGRTMALDAYALSGIWTVFNFILVAAAVEAARQLPRRRTATRLERDLPVALYIGDEPVLGRTLDLSETGSLISLPGRHRLPARVVVKIGEGRAAAILAAEVRRSRWGKDGATAVGLKFGPASRFERELIVRLLFCRPDSWDLVRRPDTHSAAALGHIASSALRKRLRRRGMAADAFAELLHRGGTLRVHLEELQDDHAVASWEDGIEPVGDMTLRLPHSGRGRVDVRVEHAGLAGGGAGRHAFTLKFLNPVRVRVRPVLEALGHVA
ncbi:MAG: glycosyltransferase [Elusimicrobia bacterium]|nr:glycosyltransferase [Elusimicrobiota bacterium]